MMLAMSANWSNDNGDISEDARLMWNINYERNLSGIKEYHVCFCLDIQLLLNMIANTNVNTNTDTACIHKRVMGTKAGKIEHQLCHSHWHQPRITFTDARVRSQIQIGIQIQKQTINMYTARQNHPGSRWLRWTFWPYTKSNKFYNLEQTILTPRIRDSYYSSSSVTKIRANTLSSG